MTITRRSNGLTPLGWAVSSGSATACSAPRSAIGGNHEAARYYQADGVSQEAQGPHRADLNPTRLSSAVAAFVNCRRVIGPFAACRQSGPAGEHLLGRADAGAERALHQPGPSSSGVLASEVHPPDRSADQVVVAGNMVDRQGGIGLAGPRVVVPGSQHSLVQIDAQFGPQRRGAAGPRSWAVLYIERSQAVLRAAECVQYGLDLARLVGRRPSPESVLHAVYS